jgi:hypothetical protein
MQLMLVAKRAQVARRIGPSTLDLEIDGNRDLVDADIQINLLGAACLEVFKVALARSARTGQN